MKLILASGSPRRREILAAMGIPFEVRSSAVDESRISADHPRTFALRAAFAKASDVAAQAGEQDWVLGADTVVAKDLLLYGKPRDEADARRMLRALAGAPHDVYTAVALVKGGGRQSYLQSERTRVRFRALSDEEIEAYVRTGEPLDKAGAYGIQGKGAELIESIEGDFHNVMGLPCRALATLIEEAGLEISFRIPPPPERWAVGA
ncbi:MAG TPA: Maf family protein [Candidatus Sumerlaeota bacterium]|nr:septum formation protein Maf [Candidatus Sumerlaeota bacterium]HMX63011.1 Maf family protein [Candidatus Sumerlaeota bacterium]HNM46235.1 Maf family protein [Candidatus Sumerlaeota bacterium]